MEIVMRSVYSVLFVAVYMLYYVNIHNTIKLISDNNKFKKMSFFLATINIAAQAFVHIAPVPPKVGMSVSRLSELLIILAIFLSHRKQLLKTVYVTLLYFSVESCAGSSVNLLVNLIVSAEYQLVSSKIVFFIYNLTYYFVFTRFIVPRKDDLKLSLEFINRKTYIFILSFATCLAELISFISAATRNHTDMDKVFRYLRIYVIPICILSFIIITILIMNSMSKFYYKRSAELLDKQLDLQAMYYEKIDEMTTDIRKFRHDYKNHMHCLKSLLGSRKIDDALEYLDSISSNPTMNKTSFKSGNTIADAILNDKAAIAERYIDVNCVLKNDMQMICISNPSDADDPELKTSKTNKNEHGFGLYNIRKTVDALDGTVNISQTSPIFVLDVMFKIKMPEMA